MSSNDPIIKIRNLNVAYFLGKPNEVRALRDINLEIYPGEFVAFLGPSGCGKSTLLYSIAGLEQRAQGDIYIDGDNLSDLNNEKIEELHQKKFGMIFQAYYLINSLSVIKNVILPQIAISGNRKKRVKRAVELMERFGVGEQANKLPNELSGGQQQRVAICRAVMNNPDIILADEPVGNLDSRSAEEVMKLLKDLNAKQKKTVILVTHNPANINLAHRVFYIKDGAVVDIIVNEAINEKVAAEKENEVKTTIPKELELLARTFSSINNAGALLAPFKAKQIVSEVLTSLTNEQVRKIEKSVEKLFMFRETDISGAQNYFSDEIEKGGLGLDKRTAAKIAGKIKDIVDEIKILEEEEARIKDERVSNITSEATQARHYLLESHKVEINNTLVLETIDRAIKNRLENKINKNTFQERLDLPVKKGGAGLDKRTARKLAKRLELLILGKLK